MNMDRNTLLNLAKLATDAFPSPTTNFGSIADAGLTAVVDETQTKRLKDLRLTHGEAVTSLAEHATNFMDAQDKVIESHRQGIAAAQAVKEGVFAAMVYGNLKLNYNPAIIATGMMPVCTDEQRKMPKGWAESEEGVAAIAAARGTTTAATTAARA